MHIQARRNQGGICPPPLPYFGLIKGQTSLSKDLHLPLRFSELPTLLKCVVSNLLFDKRWRTLYDIQICSIHEFMNSWIWSFIFLGKFFILLISKCNFVLLVWRMFERCIHLLDFDFKLICYLVVNAESGANVFKPTFYFGYISYRTSFTFLFFYSTLYSFSWVQNQNGQIINFQTFQKNVLKFINSEKATKFFEISTNYLSYVLPVK